MSTEAFWDLNQSYCYACSFFFLSIQHTVRCSASASSDSRHKWVMCKTNDVQYYCMLTMHTVTSSSHVQLYLFSVYLYQKMTFSWCCMSIETCDVYCLLAVNLTKGHIKGEFSNSCLSCFVFKNLNRGRGDKNNSSALLYILSSSS